MIPLGRAEILYVGFPAESESILGSAVTRVFGFNDAFQHDPSCTFDKSLRELELSLAVSDIHHV